MITHNFGLVNKHGETILEHSKEMPDRAAAMADAGRMARNHPSMAAVWVEELGAAGKWNRIGTVVITPKEGG
jgi:hypothetical protein